MTTLMLSKAAETILFANDLFKKRIHYTYFRLRKTNGKKHIYEQNNKGVLINLMFFHIQKLVIVIHSVKLGRFSCFIQFTSEK